MSKIPVDLDIAALRERWEMHSRNVFAAQLDYDAKVRSGAAQCYLEDAWERYVVAVSKRSEFTALIAYMGLWKLVMMGEGVSNA